MINITINGQPIFLDQLGKRVMGFGQAHELPEFDYSIKVDRFEFISIFAKIYDDCIDDLKLDDEKYDDFEPPYLGALTYPTLEEFLSIGGNDFYDFFQTYFDENIFDELCQPYRKHVQERYVANSIDNIEISKSHIKVIGKAFLSPLSEKKDVLMN